MKSRRQQRLANQIQRLVADIISSGTRDPRIGFVSIMGVDISPDLKNADIYVSILGGPEDAERSLRGLNSARGFIQGELGARGGWRHTPRISFRLDDSIDRTIELEDTFRKLKEEGQLPDEDEPDPRQADFPDQG